MARRKHCNDVWAPHSKRAFCIQDRKPKNFVSPGHLTTSIRVQTNSFEESPSSPSRAIAVLQSVESEADGAKWRFPLRKRHTARSNNSTGIGEPLQDGAPRVGWEGHPGLPGILYERECSCSRSGGGTSWLMPANRFVASGPRPKSVGHDPWVFLDDAGTGFRATNGRRGRGSVRCDLRHCKMVDRKSRLGKSGSPNSSRGRRSRGNQREEGQVLGFSFLSISLLALPGKAARA